MIEEKIIKKKTITDLKLIFKKSSLSRKTEKHQQNNGRFLE